MASEYKEMKNAETEFKIQQMQEKLPKFCHSYIVSISGFNKPLTQYIYLTRLDFFFRWLADYNPYFAKKDIIDYTIDDLGLLKKSDFEEFLHHIDVYGALSKQEIKEMRQDNKVIVSSKPATRNNYMSALNSLFNYFLDNEYLSSNPVSRIRHEKEDKKVVIALDDYQQNKVMDIIENGSEHMTFQQELFRKRTAVRDKAIYLLAMHTGIRVSELVSLDIDDIDYRKHCFTVIRKRSKESVVYFDDTVEAALKDWLEDRKLMLLPDNERALFVSMKGRKIGTRLSVRSVELMVKKYAKIGVPELGSKVTPHKLRSTCATTILDKTGNLKYAQEVLDHENITTTTRYVKENEKLREENRNLLK